MCCSYTSTAKFLFNTKRSGLNDSFLCICICNSKCCLFIFFYFSFLSIFFHNIVICYRFFFKCVCFSIIGYRIWVGLFRHYISTYRNIILNSITICIIINNFSIGTSIQCIFKLNFVTIYIIFNVICNILIIINQYPLYKFNLSLVAGIIILYFCSNAFLFLYCNSSGIIHIF